MNRVLISLILMTTLVACSHGKKMQPQDMQAKAQQMPQMTPEEMMAKVKEAGTPGAEHAQLQPLVGQWQTESKCWMSTDAAPQVDKGTASRQWIYGKRFLKEDYNGKWQGQTFQGTGIFGYDNVAKEYVSTWTDSISTAIMTGSGKFDPVAHELQMTSTASCPVTGGKMTSRTVLKILNNNQHVFEMYSAGPDGKEVKMMEIVYKRKS